MKQGLVTVLDVRPEDEFALGHLPGARNVPLSQLKRQLRGLDRNTEIVAYCRGPYCVLSFEAVAQLGSWASRPAGCRTGFPNGKRRGCPSRPGEGGERPTASDDPRSALCSRRGNRCMSYSNPAGYQRFMGRWSARLAPSFIRFAGVEDGERVLDVGCGTGSLSSALLLAGPAIQVVGVDPVPAYVAFARQAVGDPRAEFQTSGVEQLPFPEAAFDAVLACLVLQEVAEPGRALQEMARVTRVGGCVAACQWDFDGGLPMQSIFWDAAKALAPAEVGPASSA